VGGGGRFDADSGDKPCCDWRCNTCGQLGRTLASFELRRCPLADLAASRRCTGVRRRLLQLLPRQLARLDLSVCSMADDFGLLLMPPLSLASLSLAYPRYTPNPRWPSVAAPSLTSLSATPPTLAAVAAPSLTSLSAHTHPVGLLLLPPSSHDSQPTPPRWPAVAAPSLTSLAAHRPPTLACCSAPSLPTSAHAHPLACCCCPFSHEPLSPRPPPFACCCGPVSHELSAHAHPRWPCCCFRPSLTLLSSHYPTPFFLLLAAPSLNEPLKPTPNPRWPAVAAPSLH